MVRWPEWATAHFLVSVATGLPEPCVATDYSLSRQGAQVRNTTGPVCARQACVGGRDAHAQQSNARTTETRDPVSQHNFCVTTEASLSQQSPFWPCVATMERVATRLAWFDVATEKLCRDRVCVFGVAA